MPYLNLTIRLLASRACLALLVLVGCSSPSEPTARPVFSAVAGSADQSAVAFASLTVSVQLVSNGEPLPGRSVSWTVTDGGGSVSPATSLTNSEGIATTTWTLGANSPQTLVATSEGQTVVLSASVIPATCSAETLAVAGYCLLQGNLPTLSFPAKSAEYALVTHYDGALTRQSLSLTFTPQALSPSAAMAPSLMPSFPQASTQNTTNFFEARLRAHNTALARLRPSLDAFRSSRSLIQKSLAVAPLAVGDNLSLNTNSSSACQDPAPRSARVAAISASAVIVEDVANPANLSSADYQEILAEFENLIYPVLRDNFGAPSDIDNNGKVIIFFTSAVNELTPSGSPSFTGGFFFARDLFPRSTEGGLAACPGSNLGEMFYIIAPDPSGTINQNPRSTAFVKSTALATIGHELQHLINSSRRLHGPVRLPWPEAVWLDEGLAHIAEELLFYRAANLSPGSRLDRNSLTSNNQVLSAFNRYQSPNFRRLAEYLRSPSTQSPYGELPKGDNDDDIATRGAIWSLLRYASDKSNTAPWFNLANSQALGIDNIRTAFGLPITSLLRSHAAALYASDLVPDPTFLLPSWVYRSIVPALLGGSYPLPVLSLSTSPVSLTLVDGGAAYLSFATTAASPGSLSISSTPALPPGFSVYLVRLR